MKNAKWIIAAAAALALGVLTLPAFMGGGSSSDPEAVALNS
jgi:hypothetical protein